MLAKKFGFGFGIAIILPLLVHYGVSTFSPSPKWEDYHGYGYYREAMTEEQKEQLRSKEKQENQEYRRHQKIFQRNLFYVAAPTGIAAIVIGSLLAVQAIGAGLIFGGIFTLIDGYCWYWSELEDWMRFLSLLVSFVVLVYMGYMKLDEKNRGK